MVQGLAFLSKKSWHTKNKAVQEKVWVAEERAEREKQKTSELAKQIQQEREEAELAKIAGHTEKLDKGIDWMYSGQNKDSETAKEDAAKQAEEYLLGKEFTGGGKVQGDLDAGHAHEGVNAVTAAVKEEALVDTKPAATTATAKSLSSSYYGPSDEMNHPYPDDQTSVAQRNEAFRMRHEDPMFAVSMQAAQKERKVQQRMELYEKAGMVAVKVEKDGSSRTEEEIDRHRRRKEERKHRKKKKEHKHKKKKKRHRRRDDDDGDDDRRKRRRHRQERSYSDDDDGNGSPGRHRHHHGYRSTTHKSRYHDDDRYQRRSRSRSRSWSTADSYGSYGDNVPSRREPDKQSYDNRKPPPKPYNSRSDDDHGDGEATQNVSTLKPGYGLQGAGSTSRRAARSDGDLGPRRELLEEKRRAKESERRRLLDETHRRKHQSSEERQKALRAMERDAEAYSAARDQDLNLHRNRSGSHQQEEYEASNHPARASFLHEMTQRAHGVKGSDHSSMAERLRQNRNSNQRSHQEDFL